MAALTIANVQQELTTLTPEFAKTLPPGMTADRFARVALTAVQNNPDLLNCNPQSLFNACMKAAQDGLLPDGREGAIIPRKGMATWQPMVQGLVAKAKRRGSVTNLVANIVYDGEPFEVLMGDDDRIVHRRELDKVHKGSEVAVYAIATLKDGTKEREVMTWEEVQAVRKMSTTPNVGPWVTTRGKWHARPPFDASQSGCLHSMTAMTICGRRLSASMNYTRSERTLRTDKGRSLSMKASPPRQHARGSAADDAAGRRALDPERQYPAQGQAADVRLVVRRARVGPGASANTTAVRYIEPARR